MEKQDMQRIIEMLVKVEANIKTDKEETRTNQAQMEAGHKELLAKMEADSKATQVKANAD
jgi:hypothetical protein